MARTVLTPQLVTHAGTAVSTSTGDPVNGNAFSPAAAAVLEVANNTGLSVTVTIHTNVTLDGIALGNRQVTVLNGQTILFGPFTNGLYMQADGNVWVDFSVSVPVAVLAFGP